MISINMTRFFVKIAILSCGFVCIFFCSCTSSKRYYGNYYNPWRFWTPLIVLNEDSTFEYVAIDNNGIKIDTIDFTSESILTRIVQFQKCIDSTYGFYSLHNDTIQFSYKTDTLPGTNNCFSFRPNRMLWQGKNLYFVLPNGMVWKQKEYYLKLKKGKPAVIGYRFEDEAK